MKLSNSSPVVDKIVTSPHVTLSSSKGDEGVSLAAIPASQSSEDCSVAHLEDLEISPGEVVETGEILKNSFVFHFARVLTGSAEVATSDGPPPTLADSPQQPKAVGVGATPELPLHFLLLEKRRRGRAIPSFVCPRFRSVRRWLCG